MTPQSTPLPAARSAVRHNPTKHGALQMLIGECAHGEDLNAAHVNTILGPRDGPVGAAWAAALAAPTLGHVPFIAVLQSSIAVKPFTLFVTKVTLDAVEHQNLTWGAAQAGVAAGVADTVADGSISAQQCDTDVIIASVWVNRARMTRILCTETIEKPRPRHCATALRDLRAWNECSKQDIACSTGSIPSRHSHHR